MLMPLTYQEKRQLEQLRIAAPQLPGQPPMSHADAKTIDFDTWLSNWLIRAKQTPHISRQLDQSNHMRLLISLVALIFGVCGFISTSGLMTSEQQYVNLFWLLAALLGGHSLALVAWVGLALFFRSPKQGLVAQLSELLTSVLTKTNKTDTDARSMAVAYWKSVMSPGLRPWELGNLTHIAWMSLLGGSSLSLLFTFATQQYDFIWESTLLRASHLQIAADLVSTPLTCLGWEAPLMSDSEETKRQFWAWVSITSLIIYAMLPRALAWVFTRAILKHKKSQWQLDYSQSFYIQLKKQFFDSLNQTNVIDADENPPLSPALTAVFNQGEPPQGAQWFGLEVNPARDWENVLPNVIGIINDQKAFEAWREQLQNTNTEYMIFVEGRRAADRGLQRKLAQLKGSNTGLVIIAENNLSEAKLFAWTELRKKIDWPTERTWLKRLTES